MTDAALTAEIVKRDDDLRLVYGFASVIEEGGRMVVDSQGDVIEPATLEKAAMDFMASARTAKAMHEGGGVGEVLFAMPLTRDVQKALGITMDRAGFAIGMKIRDDRVWDRVKSGELRAFSIGGTGRRVPL